MVNLVGDPVITDVIIDSSDAPELNGAFRIASLEIEGQVFIYASGFLDDGVQILTMDSDGQLSPVGFVRGSRTDRIDGPADLEIIEIDGTPFLVLTTTDRDTVMTFEIDTTAAQMGLLTRTDTVDDGSPDHDLDDPDHMATFETENGSFVAVAATGDNAVFIYQLSATGDLTLVDSAEVVNGAGDLTVQAIGSNLFLYVSGTIDNGIAGFEIATDGTLTSGPDLDVDQSFGTPLQTATIGETILLVNADESGMFTVFSLDDNGAPNLLSSYDTMANDGISNLRAFEIVEIDGATFILSVIGDGIGIFSLEADGNIVLVKTFVSAADLRVATDIDYQEIDGRHFVIVSAFESDAVTTLEIGGGDDEIFGGPGDDIVLGFAGDDIMSGADGSDLLLGGAGDDFLFPGFGPDHVDGGDGNDTVVYSNTQAVTVRLTQGVVNSDAFTDTLVSIENIVGSTHDDSLTGNANANVIDGEAGHDRITGLAGNDVLRGGLGNDTLRGGVDNDTLDGGDGNDRLEGQHGADVLLGGGGNDFLMGSVGADILNGGTGNDRLSGGGQADVFVFETGGGFDQITDWQDRIDKIDLTSFEFAAFGAVRSRATEVAVGVQIDFGDGDILQINGMTLDELNVSDVLLS